MQIDIDILGQATLDQANLSPAPDRRAWCLGCRTYCTGRDMTPVIFYCFVHRWWSNH